MVEERKIVTMTEEEIRRFLTKILDGVALEMNTGVFKVIFSYSNKRKRYELRIYRENNVLFFAEGPFWETPIQMLERHIAFLKMVAMTLRKVSVFFEEHEKARLEEQKDEKARLEEQKEEEECEE
jgi:hypothetical protein